MAVNNPDLAAFFTAIEDLHTEVTIVPPSLYTTPTMTAESAPILKLDEKSLVAICDLLDPVRDRKDPLFHFTLIHSMLTSTAPFCSP